MLSEGDQGPLVRYTHNGNRESYSGLSLDTIDANGESPDAHLDMLRHYKEAVTHECRLCRT